MTTIAYKDGTMAADSQCDVGGWSVPWPHLKIQKLKCGSLIGFAGNPYLQDAFISWAINPALERPDLSDDSAALIVDPSGEIQKYVHKGSIRIVGGFCAIGSGMAAALAAMMAGATAERAIEIASVLDPSTGGKIITLHFDT